MTDKVNGKPKKSILDGTLPEAIPEGRGHSPLETMSNSRRLGAEAAVAVVVASLASTFFYTNIASINDDGFSLFTDTNTGYVRPFVWQWLAITEVSFLFAFVANTLAVLVTIAVKKEVWWIPDWRLYESVAAALLAVCFVEAAQNWMGSQLFVDGPLIYISLITPAVCVLFVFGLAVAKRLKDDV